MVTEDPLEAGETSRPRKAVGGTLEDARFILLPAEANDVLKDVVLSLLALEARFPGRVVLEIPAASGKP